MSSRTPLSFAVVLALSLGGLGDTAAGGEIDNQGKGNRPCQPVTFSATAETLKWLAEQQNADGGWTFHEGDYTNLGRWPSKPGATGLALLAFLGAGQTHLEGLYKPTVKNGLEFLVKNMKVTDQGGDLRGEGDRMIWHGMATVALCEAFAMTRDKGLEDPAQKGIDFISATQDPTTGGWPPKPGEKSRTTVTAWQLLALKSAHMAYLRVEPVVVKRMIAFLSMVQAESGTRYGETGPADVNATATAAGLLCRMHLGWKHENPALELGVIHVSRPGPSKADVLLNYFSHHVMWHCQGEQWSDWYRAIREQLLGTQVRDGDESGSWFNPDDPHAEDGGRLFQTAMNAMILETYYRHLPIYRKQPVDDEFPLGPSPAGLRSMGFVGEGRLTEIRHSSHPSNTEAYYGVDESPFHLVDENPLSTFSIDVDTASYANVRRFLEEARLPPKDAVRIEEMVNYFDYDYAPPDDDAPFSAQVEVAGCPWNKKHRLARVAVQSKRIEPNDRPAANLVFLLDVSGSMQAHNKLPLVKSAMKMLVQNLAARDRVAIAVYAGASGLVLPSTSCENRQAVLDALGRLKAGGSTNGGEGIQLAYRVAADHFSAKGTNRVILCTDGDFNVGVTNEGELTRLIQEKAESGVFLTVLGFGMGNLKDAILEQLADRGNGNYGYIDTIHEARKLLVEQLSGTLVTIAKDVKIQVEFNPLRVGAYRLIGYENRMLATEDFRDDEKDAGEIGAGHAVTALYELAPPKKKRKAARSEPLRYQTPPKPTEAARSDEVFALKLRYKQPDEGKSQWFAIPVTDFGRPLAEASPDFRFAAAVAGFGMLLRDSPHKGKASYAAVIELAQSGRGDDPHGYRSEMLRLVKLAQALSDNGG